LPVWAEKIYVLFIVFLRLRLMAAGFSALRRREEFALSGEGMFFEELLFGVPKSNQKGRIRRISPSFDRETLAKK